MISSQQTGYAFSDFKLSVSFVRKNLRPFTHNRPRVSFEDYATHQTPHRPGSQQSVLSKP